LLIIKKYLANNAVKSNVIVFREKGVLIWTQTRNCSFYVVRMLMTHDN